MALCNTTLSNLGVELPGSCRVYQDSARQSPLRGPKFVSSVRVVRVPFNPPICSFVTSRTVRDVSFATYDRLRRARPSTRGHSAGRLAGSVGRRPVAGEDGATSGFVSPTMPAVAAPDTERGGAAAGSRKTRGPPAQRVTSVTSPARSRSRINLSIAIARGGWSRRPGATSAARQRRASGHPASRGQAVEPAAKDT